MAGLSGEIRVELWWKLVAAHAQVVQTVGRDLEAATGLSLGSYNVLRVLREASGCRLRLSELARAVLLTRSGATRLAERLERAGLLCREEDTRDLRGSYAVLTERGREKWRRAKAVFERAVVKRFGSHLSVAEAKTLKVVLGRIVAEDTGADSR